MWTLQGVVSCGQLLYTTGPVEDRTGKPVTLLAAAGNSVAFSLVVRQKSAEKDPGLDPINDCHFKTWVV